MVMSRQIQEIIDPYFSNSIQRIEALYLLILSINLFFFNQQIFNVQLLCVKYCVMHNIYMCPDPMELTDIGINSNFKNLNTSININIDI